MADSTRSRTSDTPPDEGEDENSDADAPEYLPDAELLAGLDQDIFDALDTYVRQQRKKTPK